LDAILDWRMALMASISYKIYLAAGNSLL